MDAPPRPSATRRRLRDLVAAHVAGRDVARVIYGAIIGLALLLALETHPPSAAATAGVLVGTAITVGLAELYSELIATEARLRRTIRRRELRRLAGEALAVVFGAGFPAGFFVLAAAGAIELDTAFTLSTWSGLGLICAYGFLAARLSHAGVLRALVHAAVVGLLAAVLIALKALLH